MAKHQTIPAAEVALFCEQVAMLLQAGIPLHDGIETLHEAYGGAFDTLSQTVLETGSLSQAAEKSGLFPRYCVSMLHIAEQTGNLEGVLNALAVYYRREEKLRASAKSAFLYPAVLVVLMAVVIGVLVVQVLPIFNEVLRGLGADLTPGAAAMMELGLQSGNVLLWVVGILLALLIALAVWVRCGGGQRLLSAASRALPLFQKLRRHMVAERFAGVVSMMLSSGYPIGNALHMAADIAPDKEASAVVARCASLVEEGHGFGEALEKLHIFDPLEEKMLRTAGVAGQTDRVLADLAVRYEERLDESIGMAVSLIEPILVAVMTLAIGGVLLSVMLPLLSILSAIGG